MKKQEEVIYGRHPVEEALQSGRPLKKVILAQGLKDPVADRVGRMAGDLGLPVQRMERKDIDRLVPRVNHQGIVALASPYLYAALEDLFQKAAARKEAAFFLVLDHLQDPQNLGALLRTAEAVGAHGAVIPDRRAAGVTTGVYKAAAGAVEHMPVARVTNLARSLEEMKKQGLWIVGADMQGEQVFCRADLRGPLALVLGGEGKGISPLITGKCDFLVRLPMRGKTRSLNVSVAGGILLYEILRQRSR